MKKSLFVITIAITLVSCGAKKAAVPATPYGQETEVIVPCADYKSDNQALRAVASADAPNMQIAKDKAAVAARANLATAAQAFVQRVTERYAESYDVNESADAKGRYQDMTRQLAAKLLENSTIICDKLTKTVDKEGKTMYHAYVAVELLKEQVAKDITQGLTTISQDSKAQIDFDADKFSTIFDQEFGK